VKRKTTLIGLGAAAAIVAAGTGVGVAAAGGGDDDATDTPISGAALDKAAPRPSSPRARAG
jgi:hypothetical protein